MKPDIKSIVNIVSVSTLCLVHVSCNINQNGIRLGMVYPHPWDIIMDIINVIVCLYSRDVQIGDVVIHPPGIII